MNFKTIILFLSLFSVSLIFSQEDFKFKMGVSEGDEEALMKMPQKASLTRSFYTSGSLESSASVKAYAPTPKSQGSFGTCTAWAVAYGARTVLEAKKNNWTDKETITNNAFTPAFTYRLIEPDKEDCNGSFPIEAVSSMYSYGALPLKYWNEFGDDYHCPSDALNEYMTIAKDYKITDYSRLFLETSYSREKENAVKLSLSNDNPVIISMICPRSFHYVKGALWEPEENPTIGNHGRHAMMVVSYDDNKYGGAFEIQNSWGSNYGDGGYVWVKYDDFNNFVYAAIELVQFEEPNISLYKGGLEIINIETNTLLSAGLSPKFRNFNTIKTQIENTYTYKVKEPLRSGSKIRILVKNQEAAYVYVLGTGSVDTSIKTLFPVEGMSPVLNYEENTVALPNEDYHFEMDDTIGKDYIIMLYSKEVIDLKKLNTQLNELSGTIDHKLKTIYEDKIIDFEAANFSENSISFEANSRIDNQMMLLVIEFDHVE